MELAGGIWKRRKGALKGKYQGQTIVESEGMHEVAAGGTLTLPHRPAIAVRAP